MVVFLRYFLLILLPIILLVSCEESLLKSIKEDDIKNGGLSYEFEKLSELGNEAISRNKNGKVIFFVAEPNEDTRKKIDQGLIEIFGQTIDYILRDSKEFHIEGKELSYKSVNSPQVVRRKVN